MDESEGGSGSWLMTYADFITLMMIFFIVLFTFTPGVEKNKFEAIIGAFQGKDGVLKYESVFSDEQLQTDMQRAKNWDELDKMIEEEGLEEQIQIKMLADGVQITLGEAVTFATYSATLIPASKTILSLIAQGIENYEYEPLGAVEVLGHTDDRPVVNTAGRYPSNWELGASRAISVVRYLMSKTSIEPDKFEAATYGEYRPRVSNATEQGQRKNRRVEIFVKYAEQPEKKEDDTERILPPPQMSQTENEENDE